MGRGRNIGGSKGGARPAQSSAQPLEKGLLPGRHPCDCQARIHDLVMNCLNCGKIVCAQEGSGPCFFCGNLVCTREEREVLDRGSKKSAELMAKLMGTDGKSVSLSTLGTGLRNAVNFRDKLLIADTDTGKQTKVHDLECDYSNVENDVFLTPEERAAIVKRRNELREIREKRRRAVVVTLDLDSGTATEQTQRWADSDTAYDPVIQGILEKSEQRRRTEETVERLDCRWVPKGFVPRYYTTEHLLPKSSTEDEFGFLALQNDELLMAEVEKKGYAIALPQPVASLVMDGAVRFVRWPEDVNLKGPIFISSTVLPPSKASIEYWKQRVPKCAHLLSRIRTVAVKDEVYSVGCLLGKAQLVDCHSLKEFHENFSRQTLIAGDEGDVVLEFSSREPLLQPVPHIPPNGLYTLERELREALNKACF